MRSFSISRYCRLTDEEANYNDDSKTASSTRSGLTWLGMFFMTLYSFWAVYDYQFGNLPTPLTPEQAGPKGFSEEAAMKHNKALSALGPHTLGSDTLLQAVEYVYAEARKLQEATNGIDDADVQVDYFEPNTGANRLTGGLYFGRTHLYSNLSHVLVRILPKDVPEAKENAILVSAHIDTVFSAEGAGDDSSSVAVMLELARGLSQSASGLKHAVIFLFNTGEEEGLNGAHSFITQHPWSSTVHLAINLEAQGIGGKSGIFQAGPLPFALKNFAATAKYPSGQIAAQDLFSTGVIKSTTDFQIYKEVGGLSGLDFAYTDKGAVYHTKNDKFKLLKAGSFQHLGENMLPFLLQAASSDDLPELKAVKDNQKSDSDAYVYFDILGKYFVVYPQSFGNKLNISVIILTLLILAASLLTGGSTAAVSFIVSCLITIITWIFSISFSVGSALILVQVASSPVPYIASPWLAVGLFAAPALLGAIIGQHFGFLLLQGYLSNAYAESKHFATVNQADLIKFETERWLYKASFMPWLILLILGTYYNIGSSYLATIWLIAPLLAYGSLEANLITDRLPRALKSETLLTGLPIPIIVTGGGFIRIANLIISNNIRLDSEPGSNPEWLGSVIISIYAAVIICLTLLPLLSYVHLSDGKAFVGFLSGIVFALTFFAIVTGTVPAFTDDLSRALNVIHVVDTTGNFGEAPTSYISMYSITPGKLTKEVEIIDEGFVCGRDKVVDFIRFPVKYGCLSFEGTEEGWNESDIPTIEVYDDYIEENKRITEVVIDTKRSTRWVLAINFEEIEDFAVKADLKIVPADGKNASDGWHIIQFAGGRSSPTKFELSLTWAGHYTTLSDKKHGRENEQLPLLKLRTDLDDITPKIEKIIEKYPTWCSLYGKSSAPHTLSFLSNLPVNFEISGRSSKASA